MEGPSLMGRKFSTGGRGAPFGKAHAMAVSCARKRGESVSPSFGEGSAPPEGERLRRTGNCPDLSSASLGLGLPAAPKKWLGNCTASDAPRRERGREGGRTEIGLPLPFPPFSSRSLHDREGKGPFAPNVGRVGPSSLILPRGRRSVGRMSPE